MTKLQVFFQDNLKDVGGKSILKMKNISKYCMRFGKMSRKINLEKISVTPS